MSDKTVAPWTDEQVAALNRWQQSDYVHPFTCGKRDIHPPAEDDYDPSEGVLVATTDGWRCPFCDYKQNWAHALMLREPPGNPLAFTSPQGEGGER